MLYDLKYKIKLQIKPSTNLQMLYDLRYKIVTDKTFNDILRTCIPTVVLPAPNTPAFQGDNTVKVINHQC